MAAAASLLLLMASCSPDSTPSTSSNHGKGGGVSSQQSASSDLPTEPVKSALAEPVEVSAVEPVGAIDGQEALNSPKGNVEELAETNPVLPSEELPGAAKEVAMAPPMSNETTSAEALMWDFFPLSKGASWRYQLKVLDGNDETLSEATVERRVDGTKTIDGKDYFRLTTTTLSGTDTRAPDQHYRVTDEGVVAAVEGVAGKELLVLPKDPASTRNWTAEAPPVIKRVRASVTLGEQVACGEDIVPDCVRVELDIVMRGGGLFGPSEVPVRIERWFASGIGMVRERRIAGGRTIEAILEKKQP
jgi:hypothetical protein